MRLLVLKAAFALIISGSFFLVSCNKSNEAKLVEKEALINILTDLHIADALFADKGLYDGKLKDSTKSYYNYILKKYDISRADFEHSLDYYSGNPKEYLLIYDEIIARINNRMPKRLYEKSFYRLFEICLKEAEILTDLEKYYGKNGKEIWMGRRTAKLPRDTTSLKFIVEKESNYQSLIAFMFDVKITPKDSSENLRAELEVTYDDSTNFIDTIFINTNKKKKWESYKLIVTTDSLKDPKMITARLFEQNNHKNVPKLDVRRISLRLYAPDKDTSDLYYLPIKKVNDKKKNNKRMSSKKSSQKKKKKNPKKKIKLSQK
jgi:hypothetical protein